MKKVLLTTIFRVPNYGSVLQTYATVRTIQAMGCDCTVVDYVHPNEWHHLNGMPRKNRSLLHAIYQSIARRLGLGHYSHARQLDRFIARELPLTRPFRSLEQLEKADWSGFDTAVVGSDQVWNPRYHFCDKAFLLSYVPDSVVKTSIASSFATGELPPKYVDKFRRYLSRFSSLTVRENNGLEIITGELGLGVSAEVVLDPTLLLDRGQWGCLAAPRQFGKKYLLLYFLNYAFNPEPYIFDLTMQLARQHGLEVVAVCGDDRYDFRRHMPRAHVASGLSVERLLSLFAHCDMVVTSSFHGTAFAVNFGKPLVSVVPSSGSGDDRQQSLLNRLSIGRCAVTIDTPAAETHPFYDVDAEQAALSRLREESLATIRRNLHH